MFLPKRCEECIKAGKRLPRPGAPGESQTQFCQMGDVHDPEAVDTLLCSHLSGDEAILNGTESTIGWCANCGTHIYLESLIDQHPLCETCRDQLLPVSPASGDDLEISLPPQGSFSLMIELSETTSSDELTSGSDQEITPTICKECNEVDDLCSHWRCTACCEMAACSCMWGGLSDDSDDSVVDMMEDNETDADREDTDSSEEYYIPIDGHAVRRTLLEQWSGLELHPQAFGIACDIALDFFTDGRAGLTNGLIWEHTEIDPTGELVSRLFKLICRSADAHGMTSDQIELAYGLGQAMSIIASRALRPTASPRSVTSSQSDLSSTDTDDSACSRRKHPRDSFHRILVDYRVLNDVGSTQGCTNESVANGRGRRTIRPPNWHEPSPSGFRQEVLSDGEYFAAVLDQDLEDAAILSGDDSEQQEEAVADSGEDVESQWSSGSLADRMAGLGHSDSDFQ